MTVKLTAICVLFSCYTYSQSIQDSHADHAAFAEAVVMYHHFAPDQAPVHRGPEYLRKPFPISDGHCYFISDNLAKGSLIYDDVVYDSIPLLYDETSGELITSDYQHSTLISLFNPKVQRFTLFGKLFVPLQNDSIQARRIDPGFYQVLYDGKIKVYKKEIKKIVAKAENVQALTRLIETSFLYYVLYEGKFHEVTNSKSLLNCFDDKRSQLAKFLRTNRLKFRKHKDEVLMNSATFIEQLPN